MLSVLRDLALRRHAVGDVPDGVWGPASVTLPVSSQTSKAGSEVSFSSAPCFKSLRRDFALSGVRSVPRGDPAPTWKPRCQQEIEGHFTKSSFRASGPATVAASYIPSCGGPHARVTRLGVAGSADLPGPRGETTRFAGTRLGGTA